MLFMPGPGHAPVHVERAETGDGSYRSTHNSVRGHARPPAEGRSRITSRRRPDRTRVRARTARAHTCHERAGSIARWLAAAPSGIVRPLALPRRGAGCVRT